MIPPLICRGTCRICYCIFSSNPRFVSNSLRKSDPTPMDDQSAINLPLCLTCGETSEAGWAERWAVWPGQASRDGTASSSGPGSGCVGTPGLWTRGSLCLCSGRETERAEKERDITGNVPGSLKTKQKTRRRGSPTRGSKCRTRPVHTGPCSTGRGGLEE